MAAQSELTRAESALASAEAAGAATHARELYNEASERLRLARADWNNNNRRKREDAGQHAIEARHAAMAAEAQARLVAANVEVRTLRTDINNAGGNAATVVLYDPPATINRGTTTRDRVIVAETALRNARAAGAERFAAAELEQIEANLKTARLLAERNNRQQDSADHLAYVAEMTARRLELEARMQAVTPHVTAFRTQRTSLTQRAQDNRVADEQQRRLQAEREAAEARGEAAQLREQLTLTEAELGERLNEDRAARIAAEQRLDLLIDRYETALSQRGVPTAEVDQLRREVEQQRVALRTIQDRERLSETSMGNQISSLEQSLERERNEGRLTAEVLAQREEELRRQRAELDRLAREREESDRRRAEAETARAAALAEAERLRAAAESQASNLRENLAQTSAALEQAQSELARRDAESRARVATMQQELSKLAETRNTERGFIVTLPGLFFDSGKSVLKPGARNTLSKIAEQLRAGQEAQISIEGHTDSVGSDEYNQALSEKRAAAVRDYLVSRGLGAARINITGQGETAPVASNDTPAGRQQNRRVELVIATPQQ
ncbi:MAG TPA: OmpA family protein [Thermoanaerobaculia bacterium]